MLLMTMPGYFDDRSIIRRVQREHVCALAGPRALLMQAAHPVAFAGFFASTGALADPYARLRRTADVIDTVVFGEREAADAATVGAECAKRLLPTLPRPLRYRSLGTAA